MGVEPGSVFVHRNIGNVVANTDLNVAAVIDFAVIQLKVEHIIVCGHYNCGGVKAAMQAQDLGILNPWLRNIRDVYRLHKEELNGIEEQECRYERLIELSVVEQCINVIQDRGRTALLFEGRLSAASARLGFRSAHGLDKRSTDQFRGEAESHPEIVLHR